MAIVISFTEQRTTKGELAKKLYTEKRVSYDCAIPNGWIKRVEKRLTNEQLESFGNISSHFITVYDDNDNSQYIAPLTKIGCKILGIISLQA